MDINEEMMCFLEGSITEIADAAATTAYWHALASGGTVLEARDGNLVEVLPDGHRRILRSLEPSMPVRAGEKVRIV